MAVDQFLVIKDIAGESKDKKYKGNIDVLAWSFGMSQSGSMHMGGGGGAGKVSIQDLSLTKYVDKGTPNFMLYCCNGKHFPEARLIVRKAGEEALEYIEIKMSKVLVTSVSTGGSGGEDRLTENVTLNFAKVEMIYKEQGEGGGQEGGDITFGWNIEENVKI